jgi:hypothetical protein
MSHITNTTSGMSIGTTTQSVANMLNNLSNYATANGAANSIYTPMDNHALPKAAKAAFRIELYSAENGGFIMGLMGWNSKNYSETCKLFILKEPENMGRDIQNILATEVLGQ